MGFRIVYNNNLNNIIKSDTFFSLLVEDNDIALFYTTTRSYQETLPSVSNGHERIYMVSNMNDSVSSTYFIELFEPNLWIVILTTYVIILGFLIIYLYLHRLEFNQYFESIFHVIGVSTERIQFSTIALSFCIVISMTLFYILGEYFTAFLTTKLAVRSNLPFEKLDDLLLQSKYKICTIQFTKSKTVLSHDQRFKNLLNDPKCDSLRENFYTHNASLITKSFCNNKYMTMIAPVGVLDVLFQSNNE